MSRQWHGGKGDKSRVKDKDTYENNYDAIFRKSHEIIDEALKLAEDTLKMEDRVETPPSRKEDQELLGNWSTTIDVNKKGDYYAKKVPTNNFAKAGEFMRIFGQETLTRPTVPSYDLAALRLDLIQEEVDELKQGLANQNIVEIADALTDILYVVYGAGHAFGIDLDACYDEVHRSNLTKLDEDGKPLYREDGKVMKSDRYESPNLTRIILGEENV
jgi:predicted HAD superfamily Cof-like phosphohydrolase